MGKEAIIKIKNVDFSYKSNEHTTKALSDISLDIYEGEFVVLLGHNGSGKSTLAKLLNSFIIPDNGKVEILGMDTAEDKHLFDIRSKVGLVFQNPDNQLVASIIEDDIAFGPENLGIERQEIKRRVDWALNVVNMNEYRTHTPFKLSGGQKQRIAIAGILAMLPKVLVLDESTAMLDPKGRNEVLETVQKLNKEKNVTVILITHYMDEAIKADRVVVMDKGRILAKGTPKAIFSDTDMIMGTKLELPVATKISSELRKNGINIDYALTDEELVEELCRL